MTKKKVTSESVALAVPSPVESESRKQQRLDEEFWKAFEAANSKYWSAVNAAWRRYETALKADLAEDPKRHVKMAYDTQYDKEIGAALVEWSTYFKS